MTRSVVVEINASDVPAKVICPTRASQMEDWTSRPTFGQISDSQGWFGAIAARSVDPRRATPQKRIADKCARLYWPLTLVALRIAPETYETAALPLSHVGAARV